MRTQALKLGEPPAAAQPTEAATEPAAAPADTVVAEAAPQPEQPAAAPPAVAPARTAKSPPAATVQRPGAAAAETQRKPVAPAPAASAAKGEWTVQLGSFGDESNARRMAERASTFGYKASVASYKANGKTLYRVRVGAYASKGQAEATASALGAHGLTARVVAAE
jgi:DedD protein